MILIYILKGMGYMLAMFVFGVILTVPLIWVRNKELPLFESDHWFMRIMRLIGYLLIIIFVLALFYTAGGGPPLQ